METVELADNSPLEEADRSGSPSLIPTYHLCCHVAIFALFSAAGPVLCLAHALELSLLLRARRGHGIDTPALDQRTACSCISLAFFAPLASFAVQETLACTFSCKLLNTPVVLAAFYLPYALAPTRLVLTRRHPAASTSGAPLDASVGEALEEFLQYAQQLKQRAAGGGAAQPWLCYHNESVRLVCALYALLGVMASIARQGA